MTFIFKIKTKNFSTMFQTNWNIEMTINELLTEKKSDLFQFQQIPQ